MPKYRRKRARGKKRASEMVKETRTKRVSFNTIWNFCLVRPVVIFGFEFSWNFLCHIRRLYACVHAQQPFLCVVLCLAWWKCSSDRLLPSSPIQATNWCGYYVLERCFNCLLLSFLNVKNNCIFRSMFSLYIPNTQYEIIQFRNDCFRFSTYFSRLLSILFCWKLRHDTRWSIIMKSVEH